VAAARRLDPTHLPVAAEVEAMRADLATAQSRASVPVAEKAADPSAALRALPARTDMPAILGQLYANASQARLAVDTARYEIYAVKTSSLVRYQIAFPVTGPYPQIRSFIDATLATMPEVALTGLALERKSIAHGNVEAEIRMTVYTRSAP
jgi:Tfp pilus assembly protein PilO